MAWIYNIPRNGEGGGRVRGRGREESGGRGEGLELCDKFIYHIFEFLFLYILCVLM